MPSSIALTPLLRCAHMCPTALPMERWLAYLLVRVLLQVAGSRESALKPSQVPPTPCREEGPTRLLRPWRGIREPWDRSEHWVLKRGGRIETMWRNSCQNCPK